MVGFIWTPPDLGDPNAISAPFIDAETEVYEPGFDPANVYAPFIADDTEVFAPSAADSATTTNARLTQLPVEAVTQPENPNTRLTQLPVEVVVAPVPAARLTQLPVEVVVAIVNPNARLTQLPVEVVVSLSHEWITVMVVD